MYGRSTHVDGWLHARFRCGTEGLSLKAGTAPISWDGCDLGWLVYRVHVGGKGGWLRWK